MEEYWQGKREWRTDGRVLAGEKGSSLRKISLGASLSNTNLTRTGLGSNLGLGVIFNCKILLSALRTIQKP